MNERMLAAAQARAVAVTQRSHRPRERRWAEEPTALGANRASCRADMSLRAASDEVAGSASLLEFRGYATVYEAGYEMWDMFGPYTEVVTAGAGAASLNRADLDVPLVLQHDSLRRIARTTSGTLFLEEDDHGLLVRAPELDPADADVAYIAPKLRSVNGRAPLIDEMSFMFRITSGRWSPDYLEYRIDAYDIHRGDVAIVGYGASPHTAGSGLVEAAGDAERAAEQLRLAAILDLELALRP